MNKSAATGNMKANLRWALIFTALCAACAGLIFAQRAFNKPETATIKINGEVYRTVPLDVDKEYEVVTELGRNTVTVKGGSIAVTDADCPDRLCVRQGSAGAVPIVCLPHRLTVELGGEADIDAATGE